MSPTCRQSAEALRLLEKARNTFDPYNVIKLHPKYFEQALAELQKQPEPSKFTKKLRKYAETRIKEIWEACDERCTKLQKFYEPRNVPDVNWRQLVADDKRFTRDGIVEPFEKLLEALTELDRQAEQNKKLKEALFEHRWDLHQRSNRPCPTCRQSAEILRLKVPAECARKEWDKQAPKGK